MKKFLSFVSTLVFILTLVSCDYTKHPNMVEYSIDEVLEIAKEKYNITSWIFINNKMNGKYKDGQLESFNDIKIINPENTDISFTSFAGKNGNHDIQGMYSNFICYYALGIDNNDNPKFIFYNTNLNKDAVIADTIGMSDYPFDVLPNEITLTGEELFKEIKYYELNQELIKRFPNFKVSMFNYGQERLTYNFYDGFINDKKGKAYLEFYKENDRIVFDYYVKRSRSIDYELKYSSSSRYDVAYMYYGNDVSNFIDVSYTIETSKESSAYDLIRGSAFIKESELRGEVIYSYIYILISYKVKENDEIVIRTSSDYGDKECKIGLLIDKIEEVNHKETTTIDVTDFYILYLKSE